MRTDDDAGRATAALPVGVEADPEEEVFVKKALRRALDGQVCLSTARLSTLHQKPQAQPISGPSPEPEPDPSPEPEPIPEPHPSPLTPHPSPLTPHP